MAVAVSPASAQCDDTLLFRGSSEQDADTEVLYLADLCQNTFSQVAFDDHKLFLRSE